MSKNLFFCLLYLQYISIAFAVFQIYPLFFLRIPDTLKSVPIAPLRALIHALMIVLSILKTEFIFLLMIIDSTVFTTILRNPCESIPNMLFS